MSENTDKRNNDAIGIDVVLSVLESGHSVELPATGYSMFPTLKPGDRVVVKPLLKGELPERGGVVVCMDKGTRAEGRRQKAEGAENRAQSSEHRAQGREANSILVMHRLVEIKNDDSGNSLFITRGDSGIATDKPWLQQQLLGVAVSYKRGSKGHIVINYIPGEWRYKYNRGMLWMFSKLDRLAKVFGNLVRSK